MSPQKQNTSGNLTLITRPFVQGQIFAEILKPHNIATLCAPVLEYRALGAPLPNLTAYDGLIFTSVNGLQIFKNITATDIQVFAVGTQTTNEAISIGFTDILNAQGNAEDLTNLLERTFDTKAVKLLHICGEHNTPISTQNEHIQIDQHATYRMDVVDQLPADSISALQNGHVQNVTFFSSRSAKSFMRLIQQHDLSDCLPSINALCISHSVLKCLQANDWLSITAAHHPTRAAMIEMITRIQRP